MDPSAKHRIIAAGFSIIAATGADRWLAPFARGAGAILAFHRVRPLPAEDFQPNALLEITPEHLDGTLTEIRRRGFDIIALDEVPARLARPRERFVALTFDDGYRDNRDHALPILERHGAPWTMFVTAAYAAGDGRLWWVELEEAIRALDRIEWSGLAGRVGLETRSTPEKGRAFATAYRDLRAGPEERLREVIAGWCREAGLDTPKITQSLCLGWDELRSLRGRPGLSFGAHTLTHPMLAKHDEATAAREIVESREAIRSELGIEARHLAYPVGDPTSAGPREFDLARRSGFETAVTTRPGHLYPAHARHLAALPRVSINGLHQSRAATRALLSGLPFLLWNRGRRLDVG